MSQAAPAVGVSRAEIEAGIVRRGTARWALLAGAVIALLLLASVSTALGVHSLTPDQTVRALLQPILPAAWTSDISPTQVAVIQGLRLPRTAMAIVAGAGLSMSGCALQGITRNPLVSPFTLGISWAAAFGASIAILVGASAFGVFGPYMTVLLAFAFALGCAAFILGFSTLRGVTSTILILAGVGLNFLFNALAETVRFIATEQQLAAMIQWSFGSLNGKTWGEVAVAGIVVLLALPILFRSAWALNAFAAGGDELAAALGFSVAPTRAVVTLTTVMVTAAIVSFTGVIGFVGLVGPHIARLMIGGDHRTLLPFSALIGAMLVLAADMIGRLAFQPVIIPVGIVVAYLGVPLFIHLLLSRRQELLS